MHVGTFTRLVRCLLRPAASKTSIAGFFFRLVNNSEITDHDDTSLNHVRRVMAAARPALVPVGVAEVLEITDLTDVFHWCSAVLCFAFAFSVDFIIYYFVGPVCTVELIHFDVCSVPRVRNKHIIIIIIFPDVFIV